MTPPRYHAESGTELEEPPVEVEVDVEEPKVPNSVEAEPPTDEPEPPFDPEVPEEGEKVEITAVSAENVEELMDQWAEQRKATDDSDTRRELSWKMMKMAIGLRNTGQKASDVKIAKAGPGVLALYAPDQDTLFFTPFGLGDPEHFEEMLEHETAHQEGKADEGVAQLVARKNVGNARRSIYLGEQLAIEQRFDVEELLERYDITDPEAFTNYYLEEEWKQQWTERLKKKAEERPLANTEREQRQLFKALGWQLAERTQNDVKDGLPRLNEKLKSEGFKFDDEQFEIFQELYQEVVEAKEAA